MGYDLLRFVCVVDEEFHCSICRMVLEMPLQSHCDHLFCSKCINEWLTVDETCPVDRRLLTPASLKPPARYFLNMLDKLNIKCSFQPEGCQEVPKLEHLQNHLASCEYSSNFEIVCDKGCNLRIRRYQYKYNCFVHLADRLTSQDETICNITSTLNGDYRQVVTKLNQEVSQLQAQVSKLTRDMTSQQKRITKLNDELKRVRPQQEEFLKLCNASTMLIQEPPKWQKYINMKYSIDEPNVLEFGYNPGTAFAQSLHPLNQSNPSFKTQILSDCGFDSIGIGVGLTQKGHSTDVPPGHSEGSIGYRCCGKLYYDKCESVTSHACKVKDIIECGIKFPKNFINDGHRSVVVYFSKNGISFLKKMIRMPLDGLFATIYMFDVHLGRTVKIKYSDCFNNVE